MQGFNFTTKIEEMPQAALEERIRAGYEYDIPHKVICVPFIGTEEIVEHRFPEMIARCPATGYPDTYELTLRYIPNKQIPELKSLRFYLMDFVDLPISHEHLADKVFKEFNAKVQPSRLHLELKTAVRGGIYTNVYKGEKF